MRLAAVRWFRWWVGRPWVDVAPAVAAGVVSPTFPDTAFAAVMVGAVFVAAISGNTVGAFTIRGSRSLPLHVKRDGLLMLAVNAALLGAASMLLTFRPDLAPVTIVIYALAGVRGFSWAHRARTSPRRQEIRA